MTHLIDAEIGVRRLHAICADAVWRKDHAAFADCFAEDGEWKITGRELRGREAIAQGLQQLLAANERVLMSFGAAILDASSGKVTGRTYAVEQVKPWEGSALSTIGVYFEDFSEANGRWLFQRRHFDMYYFGPADLSAPLFDFPDYGRPPTMPAADAPTAGLKA